MEAAAAIRQTLFLPSLLARPPPSTETTICPMLRLLANQELAASVSRWRPVSCAIMGEVRPMPYPRLNCCTSTANTTSICHVINIYLLYLLCAIKFEKINVNNVLYLQ